MNLINNKVLDTKQQFMTHFEDFVKRSGFEPLRILTPVLHLPSLYAS